ncbi:MAG: CotH kinase family protein, partial [Chitinophagaceae bacterium]|nr:CotH kinase family protein [Chitinophagaceae bacterium]
ESINKKFCGDHFASSNGNFFKCNPATSPGPTSKSNFKYLGVDSNLYMPLYELKSKIGWNDFVKLCDSITNNPSSYENILNVDRIIWMLAFNNVFVNLDSYNGVFAQNHYIYKDQTNLYNPIIWDLNMCFGGFPFAGAGNASMGSLSLTALQQLSPANHANDDYWPLIKAIQSNDTYRRKYIAHIKTILNEFVATNQYNTLATQYRTLIDAAVSDDTNKKFTYADFQNAMNTDISIGNYDVPGISNLLNGRMAYLLSLPEFTNAAPSVSNISASNPNPTYNSSIYITANISNATDATLGFRFSSFSNFQKISMYDDGQHGDGVANDGVYGAEVAMTGASLEYYIYSENSGAGIFSPARAEHEFYTLTVSNTMPTQGSIVINEILSENKTGVVDEYNDQEDWIELYNTTNETIAMDNVYLSNDVTNPLKWKFPANTYILPHGYIVAFADKDTIKKGLHTNFKVSKDADFVSLSTSSFLLDSISLFLQTTDVSYGRYPNGTGNFQKMNTTFGYENNNYPLNVINFTQSTNDLIVYPNPAQHSINITFKGNQNISVYDVYGKKIISKKGFENISIDVSQFANGFYIIKSNNGVGRFTVNH